MLPRITGRGAMMTDPIRSRDDLLARYGAPLHTAHAKVTDRLTAPYRAIVESAPFLVLATQGPAGIDLSPRGDRGPVVTVVDDRTLMLPDRRGNNRLDALLNLLDDPRIGLMFLIPGMAETLRIRGRAEILADPDLLARFAFDDIPPATVLRIAVEQVFYHCARSINRSRLWSPDSLRPRTNLPSVGQMLEAAGGADAAAEQAGYAERQTRLY